MFGAPEPAIACTLGADDLHARLAWIRRVADGALVSQRLDGATLHLAYAPHARADLQRIVDAERRCCAFLDFELADEGTHVALRIHAPRGTELDARWLFAQFLPAPPEGA